MDKILAIDLGASNGRAMLGTFKKSDSPTISLEEIHRFENGAHVLNGTLYWNFLNLFEEIKNSIKKAIPYSVSSVAVDTWGVDFGLIDAYGALLQNPVCYRDARTTGIIEEVCKIIPEKKLYAMTGLQFMSLNTLFQVYYLTKYQPKLLAATKHILLTPDLINYFLTGIPSWEFSIASTTQMLDPQKHSWQTSLLKQLGINKTLLGKVTTSGRLLGQLTPHLKHALNIDHLNVISGTGHDTACAVVAVPSEQPDFLYISMGTWALAGTELNAPIISEKSRMYNLTNEGGYNNCIRFLKNIVGLWLAQEARRQFKSEGRCYSYSEIVELSDNAMPFYAYIDPDAPELLVPGDIPRKIKQFCAKTNQRIPQNDGQIFRIIYESIAFKCKCAIDQIIDCTNKSYQTIHLIGGGSQASNLCQMIANVCQIKVEAGPVEASALGNIAVQLMALGKIKTLENARSIIKKSTVIKKYFPAEINDWQSAYRQFEHFIYKEEK